MDKCVTCKFFRGYTVPGVGECRNPANARPNKYNAKKLEYPAKDCGDSCSHYTKGEGVIYKTTESLIEAFKELGSEFEVECFRKACAEHGYRSMNQVEYVETIRRAKEIAEESLQ